MKNLTLNYSKYNELYDNELYNALADALAVDMAVNRAAPRQDYLKIMVAIQDIALAYSFVTVPEMPWEVAQYVWEMEGSPETAAAYQAFMAPFVEYQTFELFN